MLLRHFFPALLTVLAATVTAETPFTVTDDANLHIDWHGQPLIVGERFSMLPDNGFPAAASRTEEIGSAKVFNRFGDLDGVAYRREVALKDGGKEVEISFQENFPAYHPACDDKGKGYSLRLPFKDFIGWKYTAVTGRVSGTKEVSGVIAANTPDNSNLLGTAIRQIALESPDGKQKLVIDCSPEGVNDFYSDYPPNGIMSLWGFQREGDHLLVVLGYAPHFYGGSQTGKVQLYEGTAADYDQRHAHRAYRYFSELEPDRQFVLGATKFGPMYTDAGTKPYTKEAGFGWVNPQNLTVENFRPSGAFYSKVASNSPNTFRMDNLRRGLHLLTVVVPTFQTGTGPLSIAVNSQVIATDVKLKPMQVTAIHAPVWIENGTAEIAFSGKWQIAAIDDQLLQTSAEDFSFRRGFWVSTQGPHPSVMFQSPHYAKEPAYAVNISSYALPEPGKEMAAPRKALQYPTDHAVFAPGTDWRGGAILGSMGQSNNGSFDEFAKPESLARRIGELHDDRIDAVIMNGLLSRHTYPAHLKRVEKVIADTVKAGHPFGIKFIDHSDFSELWQCDSGFRVLAESMNQLQQTIDCGLPARGLCPTNPEAQKVFFDYVINHIRNTGIDGIMVDEAVFHGLNFCGCPYCRQQFTADTGWVLPADETSSELQNKLSPLWRTWQAWRQKAIGDFWYALRQEVKKVKPDFVFIGYTTHYGMYSTYGTLNFGGAMEQLCRTWDFVGTEIMSRNIFASYRSVACFRKMKNMYRNVYDVPVFGLVYSDARDWDVMYFGWALNNMNAQATWEMSGVRCPDDKPNYRKFTVEKGNIDSRTAKPVAEIALLFSNYSRDCDRGASAHVEVMGLSQILTARHIPHEFIFEAGLTPKVLSRYKVLIVGNATALSDANIEAIKKYAENGGIVYLSSLAGYYDDIAMKRDHWLVGQKLLAGSDYGSYDYGAECFGVKDGSTGKIVQPPAKMSYMRYNLSKSPALKTVLELVADKQGATVPGLIRHKLGQGEVWFSPVAFGAPAAAFEVSSKEKMNFEAQPESEAIAFDVLKRVAGNHFVWEPLAIPDRVLTSLYETGDGKLAVHFLNATKSNYKKGEVVPSTAPQDAFAPLNTEMKFRIKRPGAVKAYAVSPDFEGRQALPLTRDGETVTVTVPPNTLRGYMIVYLE